MAKRVHQLAKELNVKSTSIVSKCQAEGLDIKNHMSVLSAGLEATIREWFSEGDIGTAVETAAPVDLEKVRIKKPKKKKAEGGVAVAEEEVSAGLGEVISEVSQETSVALPTVQVTLEKAERPKRKSPKELAEEEVEGVPAADADSGSTVTAEEAAAAATEAGEVSAAPVEVVGGVEGQEAEVGEQAEVGAAAEEMEEEAPRSKAVRHVPAPAVLKGPRIVRVEKADVLPEPRRGRPERSPRAGSGGPLEAPLLEGSAKSGAGATSKRGGRRRSLDDVDRGEEGGAGKKAKAKGRRRGRGFDTGVGVGVGGHEWGDRDLKEREERLAAASGTKLHRKERRLSQDEKAPSGSTAVVSRPVRVETAVVKEPITVRNLSSVLGIRANEIIGKLMGMGTLATINQTIEAEAAEMIALEYGVELEIEQKKLLLDELREQFDNKSGDEKMTPRPPVVAFLGHVDHGKTSLLDRIRKATVVAGEAGGITQHMGSYLYDDGVRRVTFLDTPGHKAFTEMRARGATMTDIVVLVVAADDGVMPQTEEAINHARAAGVPMVVAMNKVDLPNANETRVLGQLAEKGLTPAAWGGETEVVRTSAVTGEGIVELIEHLDYVAELRQLRANPEGPGTGWVVEAEMTTGQGVLTRLLVKDGTLRQGDVLVSGSSYGRVRKLVDALGRELSEAGPASPVEISGLDEVPVAGDRFYVVENISQAKAIADEQRFAQREAVLGRRRQVTLETLFSEIAAGEVKELNVVVKADVQGSVDVLTNSLTEMNTDEVAIRVLHAAVGGISESDVLLAQASNAIIVGFQVVADDRARQLAEREGVEIRLYRVIYEISDDVKKALEGLLAPRVEEKKLGRAEVRQLFRVSRIGVIAGCYVIEGTVPRSAKMRLIRDSMVIRDGMSVNSMRREKNDISESRSGFECGIKLEGFDDLKVGDILEAYEKVEVSRTLGSAR